MKMLLRNFTLSIHLRVKYRFYGLIIFPFTEVKNPCCDIFKVTTLKRFRLGPANWGGVNKKCDGSRQSPIDIKIADVVKTKTNILGPLELGGHWTLATLTNPTFILTNKGKTVQLDFTLNNQKITTKQGGKI